MVEKEEEEVPITPAAPDAPAEPDAPAAPAPPKRRNQYSLEFKLKVARQYAPNVGGRTFDALARKHGLSKSNVMAWVAKRPQLEDRLAAADRGGFRLDGCGRKSLHRELEDELERWLRLQAADGARVRDKDIRAHAMRLFHSAPAASARSFKASSGWLARFKQRKNLVARRASLSGGGDDDDEGAASDAEEEEGDEGGDDADQAFTDDSGGEGGHEGGEENEGTDDDGAEDAEVAAGATVDEADERSVSWVERVAPALAEAPAAAFIRPTQSAVGAKRGAKRGAPSSAVATPPATQTTAVTAAAPPLAPAPEAPVTPPPASPTPSAPSVTQSATPPASADSLPPPATPPLAPEAAPAVAPPTPAPTVPAPELEEAPVLAPETGVVTAEWMDIVDRRLDDLTQQIGHLVNGQSLLLGMLQRLVHPVAPSAAFGGSGFPMHPPAAPPAVEVAPAATAIGSSATQLDATPRTKRRRVSTSSAARTPP